MLNGIREYLHTRALGLKPCKIVETLKRKQPVEVSSLIKKVFPSVDDAFNWVVAHLQYVREEKDYWQTPLETLTRLAGDCEDGAILLAALFRLIVKDPWKVFVYVFEKPAHAVVVYDGRVYDWTNPSLTEIPEGWRLWYCFNHRRAYTTSENLAKWRQA